DGGGGGPGGLGAGGGDGVEPGIDLGLDAVDLLRTGAGMACRHGCGERGGARQQQSRNVHDFASTRWLHHIMSTLPSGTPTRYCPEGQSFEISDMRER